MEFNDTRDGLKQLAGNDQLDGLAGYMALNTLPADEDVCAMFDTSSGTFIRNNTAPETVTVSYLVTLFKFYSIFF